MAPSACSRGAGPAGLPLGRPGKQLRGERGRERPQRAPRASLAAEKQDLGRGPWQVADQPAVTSRQVMSRSAPPGQPGNPHGRWMGEGSGDVGGRQRCPHACARARQGGPAAASGPQPGQTGARGSCCVNYLPSVAAGCSL